MKQPFEIYNMENYLVTLHAMAKEGNAVADLHLRNSFQPYRDSALYRSISSIHHEENPALTEFYKEVKERMATMYLTRRING